MGYILDHIWTYTDYIELLNQDETTNNEKISETIAHIGALYLVLFCFYNP